MSHLHTFVVMQAGREALRVVMINAPENISDEYVVEVMRDVAAQYSKVAWKPAVSFVATWQALANSMDAARAQMEQFAVEVADLDEAMLKECDYREQREAFEPTPYDALENQTCCDVPLQQQGEYG